MSIRPAVEPLSKLVGLPRNPKAHDLGDLHLSLDRFGFLQRIVVNDTTGHIIAGHGRVDAMRQRKVRGLAAPENVTTDGNEWMIPVDHVTVDADQQEAAAIALNRIGEGDWDEALLVKVLADIAAASNLDGTGFTAEDVDFMIAQDVRDWSDLDAESESYAGYEEVDVNITIPTMHREAVVEWLANGERQTAPGLGKGVMRRCGLL